MAARVIRFEPRPHRPEPALKAVAAPRPLTAREVEHRRRMLQHLSAAARPLRRA
ncbi:MAG TPA: hypothetical protein VG871_12695 [Vicinamibacterales bacterium]|nr:hypothetical protein [Vicinamibacterales bacterium]